jgi:hypothetical protein
MRPIRYYKTNDPLTESIARSNLAELVSKDEEYTAIANAEGKNYYKWNTELMTLFIYENGIEDNDEVPGIWKFISHWLALTLKFVEDEKIQYYAKEFYEGRIHYLDEYLGETIYHHMYRSASPYLLAIYYTYLLKRNEDLPEYIGHLKDAYWMMYTDPIYHKIPNEDGTKLIEVSREETKKYNGEWKSPEEHEKALKKLDEFLAKRRNENK